MDASDAFQSSNSSKAKPEVQRRRCIIFDTPPPSSSDLIGCYPTTEEAEHSEFPRMTLLLSAEHKRNTVQGKYDKPKFSSDARIAQTGIHAVQSWRNYDNNGSPVPVTPARLRRPHLVSIPACTPEHLVVALPVAVISAVGGFLVSHYLSGRSCKKGLVNTTLVNTTISKDSPKVVHSFDMEDIGTKAVYCRCWKSKKFPYCDGAHAKHNGQTGDNVGPLIIKRKDA